MSRFSVKISAPKQRRWGISLNKDTGKYVVTEYFQDTTNKQVFQCRTTDECAMWITQRGDIVEYIPHSETGPCGSFWITAEPRDGEVGKEW